MVNIWTVSNIEVCSECSECAVMISEALGVPESDSLSHQSQTRHPAQSQGWLVGWWTENIILLVDI